MGDSRPLVVGSGDPPGGASAEWAPMSTLASIPSPSTSTLELRAHRVEVARHHLSEGLGVELLAHRGRALEIGEDDRHDLPELLERRGSLERGPAGEAELRHFRVLGAALRADGH
jgi:hypothetical protein